MSVRIGTIRLELSRGLDTAQIAERYRVSEADIWNALVSDQSPPSATDMPPVADRPPPVKGRLPPQTTSPRASALGAFGGGVVGGLVHAKAQLRDLKRGEDAKLLPGVGH